MLTQRLFPNVSELQPCEDGVVAMPRRVDALEVAVRESLRVICERRQFRDGVTETVVQIKLGSTQCAPSPALRMLVDQLLDMNPDKRSTIDEICETKYFDLMTTCLLYTSPSPRD